MSQNKSVIMGGRNEQMTDIARREFKTVHIFNNIHDSV